METVKDKIGRWQLLAEIFFKEDKRVFIKDIYDNFYFCKIVLVGEEQVTIDCFGPDQRMGERINLYWLDVSELKEYVEQEIR